MLGFLLIYFDVTLSLKPGQLHSPQIGARAAQLPVCGGADTSAAEGPGEVHLRQGRATATQGALWIPGQAWLDGNQASLTSARQFIVRTARWLKDPGDVGQSPW